MLKTMDRAGVKALVCSSHHALLVDTEKGNNIIRDLVKKHPGRFFGYLVINPHCPDLIEADLKNFKKVPYKRCDKAGDYPLYFSCPIKIGHGINVKRSKSDAEKMYEPGYDGDKLIDGMVIYQA